jgi:hypothetical protein
VQHGVIHTTAETLLSMASSDLAQQLLPLPESFTCCSPSWMARHTYPKLRTDDLAYPIRVKVVVPGTGFGGMLDEMNAWLAANASATAHHPAQSSAALHASAIYFRAIEDAEAFLAAFPKLILADGVGPIDDRAAPHHGGWYGQDQ